MSSLKRAVPGQQWIRAGSARPLRDPARLAPWLEHLLSQAPTPAPAPKQLQLLAAFNGYNDDNGADASGAAAAAAAAPQAGDRRRQRPGAQIVERQTGDLHRLRRSFDFRVDNPAQPRFKDETAENWMRSASGAQATTSAAAGGAGSTGAAHGSLGAAARQHSASTSGGGRGWSAKLEADLFCVAAEAGLDRAASDAVVGAARARLVPSNPGVLLALATRFLTALEGPLGRRSALAVLAYAPSLLNHAPETLRFNLDCLCDHLPPARVPAAVVAHPPLLSASPFTVASHLAALGELLAVDPPAAARLALRHPRLLTSSARALRARFEELAGLLGCERGALARAVAGQPCLLAYVPATLASNLGRLGQLLGLQQSEVARLALRQPALLQLHPGRLAEKFNAAAAALGLGPGRDGAVALAAMVVRQPSLLTCSAGGLAAKAAVVAEVLGLQAAQVQAQAQQGDAAGAAASAAAPDAEARVRARRVRPASARAARGAAVAAAQQQPQQVGRRGRRQHPDVTLAAVLASVPQLLTVSSDSLRGKRAALEQAAACSPAWAEQLAAAPRRSLALWLCLASGRYERLEALAGARAEGRLSLGRVLQASDAAYQAMLGRAGEEQPAQADEQQQPQQQPQQPQQPQQEEKQEGRVRQLARV